MRDVVSYLWSNLKFLYYLWFFLIGLCIEIKMVGICYFWIGGYLVDGVLFFVIMWCGWFLIRLLFYLVVSGRLMWYE